MLCPRCKTVELTEKKAEQFGLKLDVCGQCRGVWFDGGELERALGMGGKKLKVPVAAPAQHMECPRCTNADLYNFDYPGTKVAIDMCKKCGGIWLDGGEFPKIRAVAIQQAKATRKSGLGGIISRLWERKKSE
jgi:Zn-finger nucleic acid-binding protein